MKRWQGSRTSHCRPTICTLRTGQLRSVVRWVSEGGLRTPHPHPHSRARGHPTLERFSPPRVNGPASLSPGHHCPAYFKAFPKSKSRRNECTTWICAQVHIGRTILIHHTNTDLSSGVDGIPTQRRHLDTKNVIRSTSWNMPTVKNACQDSGNVYDPVDVVEIRREGGRPCGDYQPTWIRKQNMRSGERQGRGECNPYSITHTLATSVHHAIPYKKRA